MDSALLPGTGWRKRQIMEVSVRSYSLCRRATLISLTVIVLQLLGARVGVADTYNLMEGSETPISYSVSVQLDVTGKLQTAIGSGKAASLTLKVDGQFRYRERSLPGTGRGAGSLRSLRHYEQAQANIKVNERATTSHLSDSRRLVVAHGKSDGIVFYSPAGTMSHSDLTLLQSPADSLTVRALLPQNPVGIGDTWNPPTWCLQMMTGIEAVTKSELTCRLRSVQGQIASFGFDGHIEGAILGTTTTIDVSGVCQFHLAGGYIQGVQVKQTEKRLIGTVSPGMEVEALVAWHRAPCAVEPPLDDVNTSRIPLEPPAELLLLEAKFPWNMSCAYERTWHIFHQTGDVVVLRLVEDGSLVAQCNISPVQSVPAGQHTPDKQFVADIRSSLGDKLKAILQAEVVVADNTRRIYRVSVSGESDGIAMVWRYYLFSAASGRQVSLVFALEPPMQDRLADRDLAFVKRIQLVPPGGGASR